MQRPSADTAEAARVYPKGRTNLGVPGSLLGAGCWVLHWGEQDRRSHNPRGVGGLPGSRSTKHGDGVLRDTQRSGSSSSLKVREGRAEGRQAKSGENVHGRRH